MLAVKSEIFAAVRVVNVKSPAPLVIKTAPLAPSAPTAVMIEASVVPIIVVKSNTPEPLVVSA